MNWGIWWMLLWFLSVAVAAPAHAQQRDDREAKARELFAVGQYADALDIYGKLYAETTHPTYMRNIGRCYQNMGQPDKAISSFREYLRQAQDLAPDQRALVEGYIREMEDFRRSRAAETTKAVTGERPPKSDAPPPPAPSSIALASNRAADPHSSNTLSVVSTPPGSEPRELGNPKGPMNVQRVVGLSVGAAGLVGVAVGIVFGMQSRSSNDKASSMCPGGTCETTDQLNTHAQLVADATHEQTLAIIGLAAGGAVLIGGAALVLTSSSTQKESVAHVVPWGTAREAGLLAMVRW